MKEEAKKVMVIGILSLEQQRARTIAIARGEYKPKKDEPKVWFPSMASLSQVLSDENQALLRTIAEQRPETLKSLAELTGRKSSNLSRTLKTMEQYGLVKIRRESKQLMPEALATAFDIKTGDLGFMHYYQEKLQQKHGANC